MLLTLPSLSYNFVALTCLTLAVFYRAVGGNRRLLLALAVWLAVVTAGSLGGFFVDSTSVPPRLALLLLPMLVVGLLLGFSKWGEPLRAAASLEILQYLQGIRVIVEIVFLHGLYEAGYLARALTYAGYNFEPVDDRLPVLRDRGAHGDDSAGGVACTGGAVDALGAFYFTGEVAPIPTFVSKRSPLMPTTSACILTLFFCTCVRAQDPPDWLRYPVIAPDGKTLPIEFQRDIFSVPAGGGATKRWRFDTKVGSYEQLTTDQAEDRQSWDVMKTRIQREKVAYLKDRTTIMVKELKSGKKVLVLGPEHFYSYSDGDMFFSWSPDSRYLAADYGIPMGGWRIEDGWLLGNNQFEPTLRVQLMPGDVGVGKAAQTEAAVEELMNAVS